MSSFFDDGPTSFISRGARGIGSYSGAGAVIAPKPVSALGAAPLQPGKLPGPDNFDAAVCAPSLPWANLSEQERFNRAMALWSGQPEGASITSVYSQQVGDIFRKVKPCSPAQAMAVVNTFRTHVFGLAPLPVPSGSGIARQLPDTSRLRDLDRMAQSGTLATRNVLDTAGRNAASTPTASPPSDRQPRYASNCVSTDRPCPTMYRCDDNPKSKTYGVCLPPSDLTPPPEPQTPPPSPPPPAAPAPCPPGARRDKSGNCRCPSGTTYSEGAGACVPVPQPPPPTPGCPTCPQPLPCPPPTGGGGGGGACPPCEKPTVIQSAKNPANWLVVAAAFTMGFMFAMKKKVLAAPLVAGLPDTDD